ncbi:MAG: nitrilase-related carbon-nitrogen hydrolase [Elusimicrobiota bacterium]|jgi:predicted amidohydrolase
MKIGICQLAPCFERKEATKSRIARLLNKVPRGRKPDWLIFPEMTLSSFSMDPEAATINTEDIGFFSRIARERKAFVSFGGVMDRRNLFITLDRSGRKVSSYAKNHLFTRLDEQKSYLPGSRTETFRLDGVRISPTVCFDLRFAYLYWRLGPKTDVFVDIACWPTRRRDHWLTLLRARAIENLCFTVGVNRTGRDPDFGYCGRSVIFDPMGNLVLDCGSREGVFFADIDPAAVAATRKKLPFLKDRKAWR